jgi:hypothetical protein
LKDIINFGNRVKTAIRATNIAKPVNKPKIIVGMKFERINIENPKIIVIPVKKIALPILS